MKQIFFIKKSNKEIFGYTPDLPGQQNEIEIAKKNPDMVECDYPENLDIYYFDFDLNKWVYSQKLDQDMVDKLKPAVLNDLKEHYLNLKNGPFPVDFTDIVKNLNLPNTTDILFPTTQPAANLSVALKVKTQNENIVNFSTNKIEYPAHDRCVLWVQESMDMQSLFSQGHVFAADWVLKNPGKSIFDYIRYQQIGISGIQYKPNEIRTVQPDGHPVIIDKISLKMLMFIYSTINSKKEQLHGRYILLKTQINNCTKIADLESIKENMKTGWGEVFSDTQAPAGLSVIG